MAGMNAMKWNVASSSPDVCFWERFEEVAASPFNCRSEFKMSIFLESGQSLGVSHEKPYVMDRYQDDASRTVQMSYVPS